MAHDYADVMSMYNQLKDAGHESKAKAVMDKIASRYPKGTSAPPEEIKKGLEAIVKSSHGHEAYGESPSPAKPKGPASNTDYLARAAMLAAGVALFAYTGIPLIP